MSSDRPQPANPPQPAPGHDARAAAEQKLAVARKPWRRWTAWAGAALVVLVIGGLLVVLAYKRRADGAAAQQVASAAASHGHDHDHDHPHDHDHDDDHAHDDQHTHGDHAYSHDDETALHLSDRARANLKLKLGRVELTTYRRTVAVPAMVVARPGRTQRSISSPLTGIVTRIFAIEGEAVSPGVPLFEVRLTHEDLVQTQADFLRTSTELDVVRREIDRLEGIAAQGAIAGKTLLERTYERDRLEAVLQATREALVMHGLSPEQVDRIHQQRELRQTITITAPEATGDDSADQPTWLVERLLVKQGQRVEAGAALAELADYGVLYLEGTAFEHDAAGLNIAAQNEWPLTAVFESGQAETVEGLSLFYVAGQIDPVSRALRFYVVLPNEVVRETSTPSGHRFVSWRFRPGQRARLLIPVEEWPDRIVLPLDAVVQDGAESYVFIASGDHFDRVPVHVEYRDQQHAVIAGDGALCSGCVVALNAAERLQLALKSRTSGADAHGHGHSH